MKTTNNYARALGPLYNRTPKAVFAAITVSLIALRDGFDHHAADVIMEEWAILHACGIVPQAPPKMSGDR